MKKRITAMLMSLVLMIGLLPATVLAVDAMDSGVCGDNLIWTLSEDGVLTISGEGDMYDYEESIPEWEAWQVESVVIEEGVTGIGDWAFIWCENMTSVRIPASLNTIGNLPFLQCNNLEEIIVDEDNQYFSSDDNGTLFNKDKSELIKVPSVFEGAYSVPEGVSTINGNAFRSCYSITSIALPASVSEIGEYPFNECYALEEFVVDEDNPYYFTDENGVLYNKDKSELIRAPMNAINGRYIIPNTVTSIGSCTFYECKGLTEIVIPDSVTEIGAAAFFLCENLPEIAIPSSVTYIGNDAFYYCSGFTEIDIPDSVTYIGDGAFSWCENIETIEIPESVEHIGFNAFYMCISANGFIVDEENRYYCSDNRGVLYTKDKSVLLQAPVKGFTGSYVIPNTVTAIEGYAFYGCEDLTAVTIPGSVTSIEEYTFSDCIGLTEVTIEEGVTSIGLSAFAFCESIPFINVPASVTYIDGYAFYGSYSLLEVVVAEDNPNYSSDSKGVLLNEDMTELIYVPEGFAGNYTVPDNVEFIRSSAFEFADYLNTIIFVGNAPVFENTEVLWGKTIYFPYNNPTWTNEILDSLSEYEVALIAYDPSDPNGPDLELEGECGDDLKWEISYDGVLTISGEGDMYDYSFNTSPWAEYSQSITSIVIEDGVTRIGCSAFNPCYNLKSVSIPNTVTSIGECAFQECFDLSEIYIPASVTDIEYGTAFNYCESMTAIWVDEDNQYYSSDENGVLYNKDKSELIKLPCGYEGSYTISDSVSVTSFAAFLGCSYLTELIIPESVIYIDSGTFNHCDSLEEIVVDENNQYYSSDENGVLFNKNKTELLKVPADTAGEYEIPEGVITIGFEAFGMCYELDSITIPASLTYIDTFGLKGCYYLTEVIVDEDNPAYSSENGIVYNKDKTELVFVPDGITGVITLPESVTSISNGAFWFCFGLETIKFTGNAPSLYEEDAIYWPVEVYYPEDDPTWTLEVMENLGYEITWIPYTAFERPQGDVDGNGEVTNADLVIVARYIVELYDAESALEINRYGDMDNDGRIANADLISIARIIVGL